MNGQMMFFLIAVFVFAAILGVLMFRGIASSRRRSQTPWQNLIAQLAETDHSALELLAKHTSNRDASSVLDDEQTLPPEEVWRMVGGMKGLELLDHNSKVMIAMAAYVHEWHPVASSEAEELRMIGREIEWHVNRLRAAERAANLESWFGNYAENTAAAYCLMAERLLHFCEAARLPRPMLSELQRAL
ncbi:hypothetical protein [Silvibacterium sp.]|uniref:hypothetical protein n=1 Tax=Silvibacterium sp. TaxID=1964179 RepID=UPI0039E21EA0